MFINVTDLKESTPPCSRIMPGALIKTDNKWGHEMIAGPCAWGRQVVAHNEPGAGKHLEMLDTAVQRYSITEIVAPINDAHGAETWARMADELGEPWAVLDNCQHSARKAYYGVPSSPTVNVLVAAGVLGLLLFTASRN